MKNKILVIVVLIVVSLSVGYAKDSSKGTGSNNELNTVVSGLVIDKNSGELLAGVLVKIEELDKEVYTDFEGKFEFKNLKVGEYTVSCTLITYENLTINEFEIGAKENDKEFTLELKPVNGLSFTK